MFGSNTLRLGIALGAVGLAAVIGFALLGGQAPGVGTGGSSPVPSTMASPAASREPSAQPTSMSLPREGPLDAGTYRLDIGGDFFTVTVPDGWNLGGFFINRPRSGQQVPPVAVQFWGGVDQVYGHPCQWKGTLFQPGPTVDDLAEALADQPLRNATEPSDVTLGGYAGKYLELTVPADIDFSDCDTVDGEHLFYSWGPGGRWHQGPGQLDRLWILDVDGNRQVFDAFEMPYATDEEREELQAVVESIIFDR